MTDHPTPREMPRQSAARRPRPIVAYTSQSPAVRWCRTTGCTAIVHTPAIHCPHHVPRKDHQ